ncbi:30S ribosomal protein S16 [Candidatus Parcubacteria bacterium]|nr:MAG: 30S ribosomal protein S16 [Candidatus Parcubacteria bacterium]
MLAIRFSRYGKRKYPTYRIIVSEKSKDTQGRALEYLGHYDPHTKAGDFKKDRILFWIGRGAKLSPTLNNLFLDKNIITGKKVKASKSKKKTEEAKAEAPKAEGPKPETKSEVKEALKEEPPKPEAKPEEKK